MLTLFDSRAELYEHNGLVYTWNGYSEKGSIFSLLRYVEAHSESLRSKYLTWIHDLGESHVNGNRLIDHLALENGLSYWWMTLFAEQDPWKSSSITDAIRLLALEEIIIQQKPSKVRLVSAKRSLHEVLSGLCQELGIVYEWERISVEPLRQSKLRSIYQALPQFLQALISLVRLLGVRWTFRRVDNLDWFDGDRSLFFCSYFFNVAPKLAKEGRFHSRYWEGLHGLMTRLKLSGNWLQLYYPHDAVPNPQVALDLLQRFNQRRKDEGFHTFLDAYLSLGIVLRVLKRWLRLSLTHRNLSEIQQAFRPPDSQLSLWPVMRKAWLASMQGPIAINNLLWIELFNEAMRDLPHQKKGLYLCENQAWERALIHAWHKHGHGQLIAVAHSTMRFWDLRHFSDPRTLLSSDLYRMPQADLMALNGKAAVDAYLRLDYPKERIVECEALRYGYLNDLLTRHPPSKVKGGEIRVLILGDYKPSSAIKMLQLLEASVSYMPIPATYAMKPHPNYLVTSADYPSLYLKVVMGSLGEIMHEYDVAYSSNMTSAAVDAYLAGLPVVVMLEDAELNFSPLRGQSGVHFVSTPEQLASALQTAGHCQVKYRDHNEFFFLDPKLSRWQRLLSSAHPA